MGLATFTGLGGSPAGGGTVAGSGAGSPWTAGTGSTMIARGPQSGASQTAAMAIPAWIADAEIMGSVHVRSRGWIARSMVTRVSGSAILHQAGVWVRRPGPRPAVAGWRWYTRFTDSKSCSIMSAAIRSSALRRVAGAGRLDVHAGERDVVDAAPFRSRSGREGMLAPSDLAALERLEAEAAPPPAQAV
jgi:hypothetical protein